MKSVWIVILLVLSIGCGKEQTSETKAVHDLKHILGLQAAQVSVDGKQVAAYQFLLCDRNAMQEYLAAESLDEAFNNTDVCYNPLVAKDNSAAVFIAIPDTKTLERNKLLRNVGKAGLVAGGVVILTASVLLGVKSWRLFTKAEEYIKFFNRASKADKRKKTLQEVGNNLERRKQLVEKFSKEDKSRLLRAGKWIAGGGIVASAARWFIFPDGGFYLFYSLFDLNKKYFDDGRKILYTWGSAEDTYLKNHPHLINDEWQYTAREHTGIYHLLVGIKKNLKCEFSKRYKRENPLLRDD